MVKRIKSIVMLVGLGLLALVALVYWSPDTRPGPETPPVVWTPKEIVVTVTPGDSAEVAATATVQSSIPNTSSELVPSLEPFVVVDPTALPALDASSEQMFTLSVEVPADTEFQTIEGTLHLRAGSETIAKPLPITLNVWEPLGSDGVAFLHPADWNSQVLPGTPNKIPVIAITSPAGSDIAILPDGGLDYGVAPGTAFTEAAVLIGGHPAIRVAYRDSTGRVFRIGVAFDPPLASRPDFQIEFRPTIGDNNAEVVFDEVLQTLQIQ